MTHEHESAMVLNDQEWEDLTKIAKLFLQATEAHDDPVSARRHNLCRRIIEATTD